MLTQQEWVEGCYAYYAENAYEPGNPEDGEWEDAHYPVPKCKGGEVTIKLLKQHHAIQGVLQSEEYQHPCIWGWEANYLEGEMLALCEKWKAEQGYRTNAARTPEQLAVLAQKTREQRAAQTPEKRREIARKARAIQLATLTPEERSEIARKREAAKTPEQRSEAARRREAAKTPEQRSEAARRGRQTQLLRSVTTP